MKPEELAYLAGIVDTQAVIRMRPYGEIWLPMVAMHGDPRLLKVLSQATGTTVTIVKRKYAKAGCSEHCPDKHQHIVSESGRWSVSGAKATVLLSAVRPYLRLQGYLADEAIEVGKLAPKKQSTAGKMVKLGWPLPDGWSV